MVTKSLMKQRFSMRTIQQPKYILIYSCLSMVVVSFYLLFTIIQTAPFKHSKKDYDQIDKHHIILHILYKLKED